MIAAVDIGGTKIAVGMVTETGQVLARKESPTDAASYANGLATIVGLAQLPALHPHPPSSVYWNQDFSGYFLPKS